jgi:hypothetical protein
MQGERFLMADIEIDLTTYPRELLEQIIVMSCEQNLPVNTILVNALTSMVAHIESLSSDER